MTVDAVAFYLLAAAILGGALVAVGAPTAGWAVTALSASMAAVGLLFLVSGAAILAGAQIAVATAAVPGIILAGAAASAATPTKAPALSPRRLIIAGTGALALTVLLVLALVEGHDAWRTAAYPQRLLDSGIAATLGRTLVEQHAAPLLAASLLLLVGIVGGCALARRDAAEVALERAEQSRALREERGRRRREDRERARLGSRADAGDPAAVGTTERAE